MLLAPSPVIIFSFQSRLNIPPCQALVTLFRRILQQQREGTKLTFKFWKKHFSWGKHFQCFLVGEMYSATHVIEKKNICPHQTWNCVNCVEFGIVQSDFLRCVDRKRFWRFFQLGGFQNIISNSRGILQSTNCVFLFVCLTFTWKTGGVGAVLAGGYVASYWDKTHSN